MKLACKKKRINVVRPLDKRVCNWKLFFLFLNQTYVVGNQKNRLNERVLLSTQNTKLMGKKIITILRSKSFLIWTYIQTYEFSYKLPFKNIVVCCCLTEVSVAISVNPDQTASYGSIWSGSILSACKFKINLQFKQKIAADINRWHFQLHFRLTIKMLIRSHMEYSAPDHFDYQQYEYWSKWNLIHTSYFQSGYVFIFWIGLAKIFVKAYTWLKSGHVVAVFMYRLITQSIKTVKSLCT